MDEYIDPLSHPLRFAAATTERAPLLLLGQFLLPPSETYVPALLLGITRLYWLVALAILAVAGVVMIRTLRWDAHARFWALGMVLSLLPSCAAFPADRMLVFIGLGAFALLARFLSVAFIRDDEKRTFVIVTAPVPIFAGYLPIRRAAEGLPVPAHTRVLSSHFPSPVVVYRPDPRTLVVRPPSGFFATPTDRVARSSDHPLPIAGCLWLRPKAAPSLCVHSSVEM